jgi:hypothetical protein
MQIQTDDLMTVIVLTHRGLHRRWDMSTRASLGDPRGPEAPLLHRISFQAMATSRASPSGRSQSALALVRERMVALSTVDDFG